MLEIRSGEGLCCTCCSRAVCRAIYVHCNSRYEMVCWFQFWWHALCKCISSIKSNGNGCGKYFPSPILNPSLEKSCWWWGFEEEESGAKDRKFVSKSAPKETSANSWSSPDPLSKDSMRSLYCRLNKGWFKQPDRWFILHLTKCKEGHWSGIGEDDLDEILMPGSGLNGRSGQPSNSDTISSRPPPFRWET